MRAIAPHGGIRMKGAPRDKQTAAKGDTVGQSPYALSANRIDDPDLLMEAAKARQIAKAMI
ncbi:DUF6500 family protein [Sulfitobacter sp. SK011]|uniref:DUF6500 family protein n=1 Tax=Sulfitobacter sp. SK011 TaxID=1389004 RepID=UPI000E0BC3AB|nr:DUF6500 family protein [Sulfitobacter sp. SK011]AXI41663.1 hypothetical protein C1J02_06660 [Sulfitobacter sp. SK011]